MKESLLVPNFVHTKTYLAICVTSASALQVDRKSFILKKVSVKDKNLNIMANEVGIVHGRVAQYVWCLSESDKMSKPFGENFIENICRNNQKVFVCFYFKY